MESRNEQSKSNKKNNALCAFDKHKLSATLFINMEKTKMS